ncbi:MAG: hypothetical protein JNL97_17255, partial [Verrucomicrobiales bacterium]|nr:hypothetical protein [Verrucomicrobiales bacterium]
GNRLDWSHHEGTYGRDFAILQPAGIAADKFNNVRVDPLFVGPNDYRLAEGSPLIDIGNPDAAPVYDRLGRLRIGPPDLGCHEYRKPPTFLAIRTDSSGALTLVAEVERGTTGALQISEDLKTWRTLRRLTNTISRTTLVHTPSERPVSATYRIALD